MLELFKQDVQRWIVPQQVADPELVTLPTTLKLLFRYMPLRAMLVFRLGAWFKEKGIPFFPGFAQRLIYSLYGLEIPIGADIEGGLPHSALPPSGSPPPFGSTTRVVVPSWRSRTYTSYR